VPSRAAISWESAGAKQGTQRQSSAQVVRGTSLRCEIAYLARALAPNRKSVLTVEPKWSNHDNMQPFVSAVKTFA